MHRGIRETGEQELPEVRLLTAEQLRLIIREEKDCFLTNEEREHLLRECCREYPIPKEKRFREREAGESLGEYRGLGEGNESCVRVLTGEERDRILSSCGIASRSERMEFMKGSNDMILFSGDSVDVAEIFGNKVDSLVKAASEADLAKVVNIVGYSTYARTMELMQMMIEEESHTPPHLLAPPFPINLDAEERALSVIHTTGVLFLKEITSKNLLDYETVVIKPDGSIYRRTGFVKPSNMFAALSLALEPESNTRANSILYAATQHAFDWCTNTSSSLNGLLDNPETAGAISLKVGFAHMANKYANIPIRLCNGIDVNRMTVAMLTESIVKRIATSFGERSTDISDTFYREYSTGIPLYIKRVLDDLPKRGSFSIAVGLMENDGRLRIGMHCPDIPSAKSSYFFEPSKEFGDRLSYASQLGSIFPTIVFEFRGGALVRAHNLGVYSTGEREESVNMGGLVGRHISSLSTLEKLSVGNCGFVRTAKTDGCDIVVPDFHNIESVLSPSLFVSGVNQSGMRVKWNGLHEIDLDSMTGSRERVVKYDCETLQLDPMSSALIHGISQISTIGQSPPPIKKRGLVWEYEGWSGGHFSTVMPTDVVLGQSIHSLRNGLPTPHIYLVEDLATRTRDYPITTVPIVIRGDKVANPNGGRTKVAQGMIRSRVAESSPHAILAELYIEEVLEGFGDSCWLEREIPSRLMRPRVNKLGTNIVADRHPLITTQRSQRIVNRMGKAGGKLRALMEVSMKDVKPSSNLGRVQHNVVWTDPSSPIYLTSTRDSTSGGLGSGPLVICGSGVLDNIGYHVFDNGDVDEFRKGSHSIWGQLLDWMCQSSHIEYNQFESLVSDYIMYLDRLHDTASAMLSLREHGITEGDRSRLESMIHDAHSLMGNATNTMKRICSLSLPGDYFDTTKPRYHSITLPTDQEVNPADFIHALQLKTMKLAQYTGESAVVHIGAMGMDFLLKGESTLLGLGSVGSDLLKKRSQAIVSAIAPSLILRTLENEGIVDRGKGITYEGNRISIIPISVPIGESRHDPYRASDGLYLVVETNPIDQPVAFRLFDIMGKLIASEHNPGGSERIATSGRDSYHKLIRYFAFANNDGISLLSDQFFSSRALDIKEMVHICIDRLIDAERFHPTNIVGWHLMPTASEIKFTWVNVLQVLSYFASRMDVETKRSLASELRKFGVSLLDSDPVKNTVLRIADSFVDRNH